MPQSTARTWIKQIPQWDDEDEQDKLFSFSDTIGDMWGDSPDEENQTGNQDQIAPPSELPILPLRGLVVYPQTAIPLTIGQPRSIRLIDDVVASEQRLIGLVASKNPDIETPGEEDLYNIGTLGMVHRLFRAPDGTIRLLVQGVSRFNIDEITQCEPYFKAKVSPRPEIIESGIEVEALSRNARDQFEHIAGLVPSIPRELIGSISSIQDPLQTAYTIANFQRMELGDAQTLLEQDSLIDKLRKLVSILTRESEVLDLGQKIQNEARSEIEKVQREYFLREQIKAIKKELGDIDEQTVDAEELGEKLETAKPSEEALKMANRELDRLSRLPTAAAEYGVIRTYVDWIASLPWSISAVDNLNIEHARQVLEEDHYGLSDVKERIIEFLAVRNLRLERKLEYANSLAQDQIRREREGVILCFVGPPGVGKTSLGKSIARAMGRKFIRLSLGGMRDEAEIRGHRRTYIGALPGRILQAMRRAESRNPVFMLDEIDKITMDFHGDPAAALLEVLDPEQNIEFRDNYLEVAFDLSQVMFITTANQIETIPPPLLDRMEVIRIAGYTEQEKKQIAIQYLLPRQVRENGLHDKEIQLKDKALISLIRNYTREAGVRNLERQIGAVCRKVAVQISTKSGHSPLYIDDAHLKEMIGRPPFLDGHEIIKRTSIPGVATGLAWTPSGGEVLFIEATSMPGGKSFNVTGSIGNVMQESALAALSYIRSHAVELKIDPDFYSKLDIHLHIPSGAQPKDGPSAGITIATALMSLLTNSTVHPEVGMTGEITLRGQVLPVGGIKEKILAAHRVGLKTVILPKENEYDLEDIPKDIQQSIHFIFVNTVDEVIQAAFSKKPRRRRNTDRTLPSLPEPENSN
jgi:ATP-dependent Lon protease